MAATIHRLPVAANSNETVAKAREGGLNQGSYAALVQGYSLSILAQPQVDLTKFPALKVHEANVNNGLAHAKIHATTYLNEILPAMIITITDLDAYFNLQNALPNALRPGMPAEAAVRLLHSVQGQVETYRSRSDRLAGQLRQLAQNITSNQESFATFVTAMNTAVKGDNGILKSITNELNGYDKQIGGLSAGIALGGLAAIGGVLVIIAGAVGTPFTAGGSTPIIAGGVALLALGAGAVAGSAIGLAAVLRQKSDALQRQAQLNEQVTVATSMSTAFQSFATNAGQAANASQMMANTWTLLGGDLGSLITSLESGQTDVDALRELYVEAAKGNVATIKQDIQTIRGQLIGVKRIENPNKGVEDIVMEQKDKAA
jgi:non-hemolytic enterotoxin B/C